LWLVYILVDYAYEANLTPVEEMDGPLSLKDGFSGVNVLGEGVSSVYHAFDVSSLKSLKAELVISATECCSF
jgi:hypothetical protein